MSRLTDLIAQAKAKDSQMGADLDREFKALSSRLPFGLNFERHRPEAVELPQRPVRKGDKVRVLHERGSTKKGDLRLWRVVGINKARKTTDLVLVDAPKPETKTVALGDLVVVAEFRDTIYPGLVSTGKVMRGGDKPCHTVINGENYHVLKALTWTHRGKVDAIYIDPPYNSGAKDWKYNNDYVEGDDLYRHSKWLATDDRQEAYRQISALSREPQDIDLVKPVSWMEATAVREQDGREAQIPTHKNHLLCDEKGLYPVELKSWESKVLEVETRRPGFKFWYRNPGRPSQDSLGVAYVAGDEVSIVRPDFLFFGESKDESVAVDIVDPHGTHLADALPKLRGLARYAETHPGVYRRIEAVAEAGGKMRVLDLTRADVRKAIAEAGDAESVYEGALGGDYGR